MCGYEWDQANSETRPRHVLEYAYTKNVCECQKKSPPKNQYANTTFFLPHPLDISFMIEFSICSIYFLASLP